jgi:hypothetical protein
VATLLSSPKALHGSYGDAPAVPKGQFELFVSADLRRRETEAFEGALFDQSDNAGDNSFLRIGLFVGPLAGAVPSLAADHRHGNPGDRLCRRGGGDRRRVPVVLTVLLAGSGLHLVSLSCPLTDAILSHKSSQCRSGWRAVWRPYGFGQTTRWTMTRR